jgi:hypothetical protein
VRCGSLRQGKAVAARMLWVGLDVVRQEFAKVRRGRDACGMFRQSRSLTDRTGAVWRGDLWFGSLGQVRFYLARFGWAGSLQRSVKARSAQEGTREIRTGAVRQ